METRNAVGGGSSLDLYVELVVSRGRGERVFLRGLRKWRDARSGTGSGSAPGISTELNQRQSDSSAQLRLFRADDEVLYLLHNTAHTGTLPARGPRGPATPVKS